MTGDSDLVSDSVVMGNVEQNITNVFDSSHLSCPECGVVSSVISVMLCSTKNCNNQFCDLCHPDCRWIDLTNGYVGRFDSGDGVGPFCELCMSEQMEEMDLELMFWRQGKKLFNARLFAIGITVLLGIVVYFNLTLIPSNYICSLVIAIPTFISWMRLFLNKSRYNRIALYLEV